MRGEELLALDPRVLCEEVVVPEPPGDPDRVQHAALLPAAADDRHELDVVRGDVTAAPARHVEVLVHDRDADVLLRHLQRKRRRKPRMMVMTLRCASA